jgi:hypothetical protein
MAGARIIFGICLFGLCAPRVPDLVIHYSIRRILLPNIQSFQLFSRGSFGLLQFLNELIGVLNRPVHVFDQTGDLPLNAGRFTFQRRNRRCIQVVL